MPDPSGANTTTCKSAADLDDAALEAACLADDLSLLASVLEDHGYPCVAAAFRQSARHRRVRSLLQQAQAVAARVV
jgi:hypothetical protein